MEDYSAKLTAEPFLYNETKTHLRKNRTIRRKQLQYV